MNWFSLDNKKIPRPVAVYSKQRDERLCLTFTRGTTHISEPETLAVQVIRLIIQKVHLYEFIQNHSAQRVTHVCADLLLTS